MPIGCPAPALSRDKDLYSLLTGHKASGTSGNMDSAVNIARLVEEFPAAGEVRPGLGPTFYHLSKEQAKMGLGVHVICKRLFGQERAGTVDGVYVHRVESPYNFWALAELLKLSRRLEVGVVHTHATSCPSYALLNRFLDYVPHVAHVHGTTKGVIAACREFLPDLVSSTSIDRSREALLRSISILRENIAWGKADAIIAVSNSVSRELIRLYGLKREKIYVAGNGVDPEIFHPRQVRPAFLKGLGLDPDAPKVLYTGGFRPMKGAIFLIKALHKARRAVPRMSTIFLGQPTNTGYASELLRLVKGLGLTKAIRIVKPVPYLEMPEYYSVADAVVVPSVYEAFGKVPLEALACGVPVVGFSVGALRDVVTGETGVLVEPGDVEGLSDAIAHVASNPDFKRRIVERERQSLIRAFSWRKIAERVLSIYREVLDTAFEA